jgi:hypothetical protein
LKFEYDYILFSKEEEKEFPSSWDEVKPYMEGVNSVFMTRALHKGNDKGNDLIEHFKELEKNAR